MFITISNSVFASMSTAFPTLLLISLHTTHSYRSWLQTFIQSNIWFFLFILPSWKSLVATVSQSVRNVNLILNFLSELTEDFQTEIFFFNSSFFWNTFCVRIQPWTKCHINRCNIISLYMSYAFLLIDPSRTFPDWNSSSFTFHPSGRQNCCFTFHPVCLLTILLTLDSILQYSHYHNF